VGAGARVVKLATWNVNSLRVRLPRLTAWLGAHAPDVLCLQETKVEDALFPAAELAALGYHAAFVGQRTYNGVAILARAPLTDVAIGLGDDEPDDQARLIAATVAGGVRVVCVYVPNGSAVGTDKYVYKLRWLERLRAYFARHGARADAPWILCGDMNVAPDDRDVYDPARWGDDVLCSQPERAGLRAAIDWGMADAFRHLEPAGGHYSWWDYRGVAFFRNQGLRIDHIYATPPVLARVRACSIDRAERKGAQPSDHAPVLLELAP
jgi:exodeoxyribonuclease-3